MITIPEFYEGKSIFLTGGSGFIGKVLIEKVLRSCPGVGDIYILMRPKRGQSVQERITDLIKCKVSALDIVIQLTSVGTIIDYNRRLLGCLFHNDLSIMKLVIDNNRKIRHLAAKHETKKRQVVSFLAMKLKLQNT